MSAAVAISIHQGESLQLDAVVADNGAPVDLTGCTASTAIRRTYGADIAASGSTTDGRITITALSGLVAVNIPPAATLLLEPGSYVQDVKLTFPSGIVEYIADVQLEVLRRVTV